VRVSRRLVEHVVPVANTHAVIIAANPPGVQLGHSGFAAFVCTERLLIASLPNANIWMHFSHTVLMKELILVILEPPILKRRGTNQKDQR